MLLERWPAFLQKIFEFEQIAKSEQPELDALGQAVEQMHQEFSVYTATNYGLTRLETIYAIPSEKRAAVEERRTALLSKILFTLPYTYRRIVQVAKQVTGVECRVDLDPNAYAFMVNLLEGSVDETTLTRLGKQIQKISPANMNAKIARERGYRGVVYTGCALQQGKIITIRQVV